jgi:pre-60S factor REI1
MASMQPVSATGANSASHPYTCNTCQVAYRNIDLQKGHMKSDWQ